MSSLTPPANPDGRASARVLVVEDEVAISLLLEDMLLDLGCEVVGPAARLAQALELARNAEFDVAILDVNVGGEPVYPVADVLAERGKRYMFSTGYGAAGIEDAYRSRPLLQKPFSEADLGRQMKLLLAAP